MWALYKDEKIISRWPTRQEAQAACQDEKILKIPALDLAEFKVRRIPALDLTMAEFHTDLERTMGKVAPTTEETR